MEENPALRHLLMAQEARETREQEQRDMDRIQSGSEAQGSGHARQHDAQSALKAVHDALKQRSNLEGPIQSSKDLSDLRVRHALIGRLYCFRVSPEHQITEG